MYIVELSYLVYHDTVCIIQNYIKHMTIEQE